MAKFFEVKRAENPEVFRFECDKEDGDILINVDHIVSIIPNGETCLIMLNGYPGTVHAQHSTAWVMGLINGKP